MSGRRQAIESYMRQAHGETWPVLSALSEADLARPVYNEGEGLWSVRDVIGHLADAESGLLGQVRRLIAGQATVPEDFDLDRWNRGAVRRSRNRTLADLLDQIRGSHEQALVTVRTLDDPALDLEGRHSSGAILSAEGFFRRMADHRREHTRDLTAALEDARPDGAAA